jgi:hypothetical protein
VWRPESGTWFWVTSSSNYDYAAGGGKQWGVSTDVSADRRHRRRRQDRSDRLAPEHGTFFWLISSANYDYASQGAKQWGNASLGDVPLVGTIDGDRKADLAVCERARARGSGCSPPSASYSEPGIEGVGQTRISATFR